MESHDYRLERWLAVLLSLLFFLPFVARADDVLLGNVSYHGDEMPYRDGEEFLAITEDCVLAPVRIRVQREEDPIVDVDDEKTGKHVAVAGFGEFTFLVRGKRLHPGKFAIASPDYLEVLQPDTKTRVAFKLGSTTSHLFYRCGDKSCAVVLETNGVTQDLVTVEVDRGHVREVLLELSHTVHLAGDLDHDGKLDLLMDGSTHWNETRPTLFLSTSAKEGQLVGKAAEIVMSGC